MPRSSRTGVWLQVQPGETVSCNGCHKPQEGAQQPVSHGRQGTFNSAWVGGSAGFAFPDTIASGPAAFIPTSAGCLSRPRRRRYGFKSTNRQARRAPTSPTRFPMI